MSRQTGRGIDRRGMQSLADECERAHAATPAAILAEVARWDPPLTAEKMEAAVVAGARAGRRLEALIIIEHVRGALRGDYPMRPAWAAHVADALELPDDFTQRVGLRRRHGAEGEYERALVAGYILGAAQVLRGPEKGRALVAGLFGYQRPNDLTRFVQAHEAMPEQLIETAPGPVRDAILLGCAPVVIHQLLAENP